MLTVLCMHCEFTRATCTSISTKIRRAIVSSLAGSYGGDVDVSEVHKKLDIHCNDVLIKELRKCGKHASI
jgi:fructose-1,6-bisphosphatase